MKFVWAIYRLIRPFFKFINADTLKVAKYLVAIYERNVNLDNDQKRQKAADELTNEIVRLTGEKAPKFIVHFLIELALFYFRKPKE